MKNFHVKNAGLEHDLTLLLVEDLTVFIWSETVYVKLMFIAAHVHNH